MANQYLQITFKFVDFEYHHEELQPVFDHALDWYRYGGNIWIVWTSSTAEKWYERLKPHIKDADNMFIVKLDTNEKQGWMPKDFWDWINKQR